VAGCPQIVTWRVSPGSLQSPRQSANVAVAATHAPPWHRVPPLAAPQHCRSCARSVVHAPPLHRWQAAQSTGLLPTQTPSWQVSVWVQASPSSQPVPSATFTHRPVAGLQLWHCGQPVAQVQGPQLTGLPQLLRTVPHLPAQVFAREGRPQRVPFPVRAPLRCSLLLPVWWRCLALRRCRRCELPWSSSVCCLGFFALASGLSPSSVASVRPRGKAASSRTMPRRVPAAESVLTSLSKRTGSMPSPPGYVRSCGGGRLPVSRSPSSVVRERVSVARW
jgi:hypothetical protein